MPISRSLRSSIDRASTCLSVAITAVALLVSAGSAHAVGNVSGATVINVDARADGFFLITFSQASTTPPSCVAVPNRMTGNANTAGGKAVLAAAMLAYGARSPVALAQGNGACGEYAGIESIMIFSQGQ